MSNEIENKAIGTLKELYTMCAKLVHIIYNGEVVDIEAPVTISSPNGCKDVPLYKWFAKKEANMIFADGVGFGAFAGKGDFWRLFSDKDSNLYREIDGNIQALSLNEKILQGYIKRLLGAVDHWEEVEEPQQIDQTTLFKNGFILEGWKIYKRCKKQLEGNIKAILKDYGLQVETVSDKPQQVATKQENHTIKSESNRVRGRQKGVFKDRLINDNEGKHLETLHKLIDGKIGKDVSLVILGAIKSGWITRPTYNEVLNEFGNIGVKSGYNKYLGENYYSKEEIDGILALLK